MQKGLSCYVLTTFTIKPYNSRHFYDVKFNNRTQSSKLLIRLLIGWSELQNMILPQVAVHTNLVLHYEFRQHLVARSGFEQLHKAGLLCCCPS